MIPCPCPFLQESSGKPEKKALLPVPLVPPGGAMLLSPESQVVAVGLSPQTRELLALSSTPVLAGTAPPLAFHTDDSLDEDLIRHAATSLDAVSKELAALNSQSGGAPDFALSVAPKTPSEKAPAPAPSEEKRPFAKPGPSPAPSPGAGGSLQSPLNFLAEQALALGQPPQDKKPEGSAYKDVPCPTPTAKLLEAPPAKPKHHSLPRPVHGPQTPSPVQASQVKVFPVGAPGPKNFSPSPPFAKLQGPKAISPLPQRSLLQQQQQVAKTPIKTPPFHSSSSTASSLASTPSPGPGGSSHKSPGAAAASLSLCYAGKHGSSSPSAGQPFRSPFVALSRHVGPASGSPSALSASPSPSSGSLLSSPCLPPPGQAPPRSSPSPAAKKTAVSQKLTLVAPPGGPNVSSSGGTQGVAKLLTSSLKPTVVGGAAASTSLPVSGLSE